MSLGLNPKCLQRLFEVLANALEQVTVKHGMFVDIDSLGAMFEAESVLPQHDKFRNVLSNYISDTPVVDFVYQYLSQELQETREYGGEAPSVILREIGGYEDLVALAGRLVTEFESLPWDYVLTIPLPGEVGAFLGKAVNSFVLSESLSIITPDDGFSGEFPLVSGISGRDKAVARNLGIWPGSLLTQEQPTWTLQTAHLQVRVKGFVGEFGTTATIQEGVDLAKAFFGIGIALGLFALDRGYRPNQPKAHFYLHKKFTDGWVIERTQELGAAQSDVLHDLTLFNFAGRLIGHSDKETWAREVLGKIARTFSMAERSRRIILASQWLFDSYCRSNELLSFVQTAVVMEILLGDKVVSDLMGLGELLSNRCAYLISESQEERDRVLSDFRKIYAVRSSIVHTGKKRLNKTEWALFSELQWMCSRVIQEEVKLLKD